VKNGRCCNKAQLTPAVSQNQKSHIGKRKCDQLRKEQNPMFRSSSSSIYISITLLIVLLGSLTYSANAASLPTISAAPNPCSGNAAGQTIPVWTATGNTCISESQYNASSPGAVNLACPNGGVFLNGTWQCNTGPRPVFSQQYLECLMSGLASIGLCDPAGLATELLTDFSPGVSTLSAVIAAAEIAVDHQTGWPTICAAVSLATSSTKSLPVLLASATFDGACLLSSLFGGPETPPTVQLFTPQVSGLNACFNGVMLPTTSGASIPNPAFWSFGDGSSGSDWFPACHKFEQAGTYIVTVTATDSNGLQVTTDTTVTVISSQNLTSPTIQLFTPYVSGLSVSFNGVMLPTTSGASIPNPAFWSFGDGTSGSFWFPANHFFPQAGTYTVTVTATDSNGLVASATVTVEVN
jgi:hypothetical protein